MNIRFAREGVKVPAYAVGDARGATKGGAQVVAIDVVRWRDVDP